MILYICPGQGRQKHTTNHQREQHAIWIVCLLCCVVHPKALCDWIWLVEAQRRQFVSPWQVCFYLRRTLWCMEKLWLGYPSQTTAQEILLLCIILNSSLTIHCNAFIPCSDLYFKLCAYCLSNVMGDLVWNILLGTCSSDMKKYHLNMRHCLSRKFCRYIIWKPTYIKQ